MAPNTVPALLAGAATTAASVGFNLPVKWLIAANLTVTLATFSLLVGHRGRISKVEAKQQQLRNDVTDLEDNNS